LRIETSKSGAMTKKKILIIGSGKRVHATLLPVLETLRERYSVHKICSKDDLTIRLNSLEYRTESIKNVGADELAAIDLVYLAVTKQSVPSVLKALTRYDVSGIDLLIETPVLLFKHICHASLLKRFKNVWVAEDCVALPCFDVVKDLVGRAVIGDLKQVVFNQSAYKYHGLASLKALLNCNRITSAFRKKIDAHSVRRNLRFANRKNGQVFEPRDYGKGRFILEGNKGSISDYPDAGQGNRVLEPIISNATCTGFRVGDDSTHLEQDEVGLMGKITGGSSVTSIMEPMKRVGFSRLMKSIHAGKGAYPLEEALDDMVIDYYLDKIGFFFANPLMSVKSGIGSRLLKTATRMIAR